MHRMGSKATEWKGKRRLQGVSSDADTQASDEEARKRERKLKCSGTAAAVEEATSAAK